MKGNRKVIKHVAVRLDVEEPLLYVIGDLQDTDQLSEPITAHVRSLEINKCLACSLLLTIFLILSVRAFSSSPLPYMLKTLKSRLACDHLFGKLLFAWLSLVVSVMVSFVLSFFPRDVLDEILNLIESVSEDFPSYSPQSNGR